MFLKAIENPLFSLISQAAETLGSPAYVVGGYVRDYLLGKDSKDIDVTVVGNSLELAERVAENLAPYPCHVNYYKHFGVAMINYQNITLEFVSARKESYNPDSRKPHVQHGSLFEDLARRDCTFNALAISLNRQDYGTLIDKFNGLHDLKNKILRTPLDPNQTYIDDPLRMMRAIRFATQLECVIENSSYQAICDNHQRISIISAERVVEELHKILLSTKPSIGFILLEKTGLLKRILPELVALKGVQELDGKSHKENFFHTLQVVDNIAAYTENIWLRWSALLHDIGKAQTKSFDKEHGWCFHAHEFIGAKMVNGIFKRLKLPVGEPLDYVKKMVSLSSRPVELVPDDTTDSAFRRLLFDAGDDINDLMQLCLSDITTKNEQRATLYKNNLLKVKTRLQAVEERDKIRNWQPPIDGNDIITCFNLQPSPVVGELKKIIREAILDGIIPNERKSAWLFLIEKAKDVNLTPVVLPSELLKNSNNA